MSETWRAFLTYQPRKYLQLADVINLSDNKLVNFTRLSVRINYETSRFKGKQTHEIIDALCVNVNGSKRARSLIFFHK